MTLKESIEREEALAYSFGERWKRGGEPVGDLPELEQEHRQMAEWLRELKAYKEAQPTDAVSRTLVHEAITASIAESENPYEMWQRIETLPSVTPQIEPCEDCISREEVFHILDAIGGEFDKPREAVVPVDYIADEINDLPPVTPQRPKGE